MDLLCIQRVSAATDFRLSGVRSLSGTTILKRLSMKRSISMIEKESIPKELRELFSLNETPSEIIFVRRKPQTSSEMVSIPGILSNDSNCFILLDQPAAPIILQN